MRRYLGYLLYVLTHKYYVYKAGRILGLGRWQLLMHDISKFGPSEFGPYARRFYDENGQARVSESTDEFKLAVHHHRRRNPHHPQYWHRPNGAVPFEMPDRVIREMVADWAGAGRVKTGSWDIWPWALEAMPNIELYPGTEGLVWALITQLRAEL